jgi:solute carrier family 39 (zinc transporter), member 1/2/3
LASLRKFTSTLSHTIPFLKSESQPYAFALALLSIFSIFIVELVAFRWGSSKLAKLGITHDPHGHNTGSHAAHGPETNGSRGPDEEQAITDAPLEKLDSSSDEHSHDKQPDNVLDKPSAQVLGIFILEFGVVLHRYEL